MGLSDKKAIEESWNTGRVGKNAYSRSILFPFRWFRPNPPFLEGNLPSNIRDPWARREAWRYHPVYHNRWTMYKTLFPGLGWALGAFTLYVVAESMFFKKSSKHGDHAHH